MASLINFAGDDFLMRHGVVGDAGAMVGMMGAMMQKQAADKKAAALKAQGEAQAQMYEMDAAQEVAAAQRISIERAYKDRQVEGTAKALAASSGGTMDSPTVLDIFGEMKARDQYGRESDLYQGNEKARRLKDSANLARYGADIGAAAARAQGTAAMIGGLQGMAKGMSSLKGSFSSEGSDYSSNDSGYWDSDSDWGGGWGTEGLSFDFS